MSLWIRRLPFDRNHLDKGADFCVSITPPRSLEYHCPPPPSTIHISPCLHESRGREGRKEGRKEGFESARRRRGGEGGRLETEPTFSRCTVSKQSLENMETTMLLAVAASTDRGNNRPSSSPPSSLFCSPRPPSSSSRRSAKSNAQRIEIASKKDFRGALGISREGAGRGKICFRDYTIR